MPRQLTFKFEDEFSRKWRDTLTETEKGEILMALTEMIDEYFRMKQLSKPKTIEENKNNGRPNNIKTIISFVEEG